MILAFSSKPLALCLAVMNCPGFLLRTAFTFASPGCVILYVPFFFPERIRFPVRLRRAVAFSLKSWALFGSTFLNLACVPSSSSTATWPRLALVHQVADLAFNCRVSGVAGKDFCGTNRIQKCVWNSSSVRLAILSRVRLIFLIRTFPLSCQASLLLQRKHGRGCLTARGPSTLSLSCLGFRSLACKLVARQHQCAFF